VQLGLGSLTACKARLKGTFSQAFKMVSRAWGLCEMLDGDIVEPAASTLVQSNIEAAEQGSMHHIEVLLNTVVEQCMLHVVVWGKQHSRPC
jgi:hypothetical protein